jgi:hypothetical protein
MSTAARLTGRRHATCSLDPVVEMPGHKLVYVSGDPKGTLTYNTFLRGVRYEGSEVEVVRAGRRMDWGGVQADA